MNRIHFKKSVLAVIPACAAFLVMQACGGSDSAVAQEATADPIEGVWEGVVTIRDCTTSAPIVTFLGSQMFNRAGTMNDTNSSPTATRGPGWGTWVKTPTGYVIKFRFFTYDSTGVVNGVARTIRTVSPGATAGSLNGVNSAQFFDLSGTLVRSTCGTDTGTKVL